MTLHEAIERLYDLSVGVVGIAGERHERPHKPLLLLAVFDLIDEGPATPERIPWCQELRDRFTARFNLVRKHDDKNTPDNPFNYLQSEGFWQAWKEGNRKAHPVDAPLLARDLGHAFARFTDGFQYLVSLPTNRQIMRDALVSRYFPHLSQIKSQQSEITNRQSNLQVTDEPLEYGRSPAFRRKILAIYDHQCAACGLRIKIPAGNDVSFIDAAHLIPFSESQNDHPTNGLALCKNHHWAMDRDILAPGPDLHWHVSKLIDPRRSNGERELSDLAGKSVLLPKDPAFLPDEEGVKWRLQRLSA